MQSRFLDKIALNLLTKWRDSFSYESFVRKCVSNSSYIFSEAMGWEEPLEELRENYKKAKTEATGKEYEYNFPLKEYATAEDMKQVGTYVIERMPHLTKNFEIERNTRLLTDLLELTTAESLILQFAIYCNLGLSYPFADFFSSFSYYPEFEDPTVLFRSLFDITEEEAIKAVKGFLFSSGIIVRNPRMKNYWCLTPELVEAFTDVGMTTDSLSQSLFPSSIETKLTLDMYPHFTKEIDRTESIIGRSLEKKLPGINVMFWGIPGTGKTELALALAAKNGWDLKVIGDVSKLDNQEKSRAQRIASLKIAMKLYSTSNNTVLLFDEMEDLSKTDNNASFSKAFINRIIESTPVPIIWTTNCLKSLGNAILRRMTYNIGFEVPPAGARKTMWRNYTTQHGIDVQEGVLDDLAQNYDIVPALISNAVKITAMAQIEHDKISEIVQNLDRLVNYGHKRRFKPVGRSKTPYNASWANTDINLDRLTDQMLNAAPNFNFCAHGAPGTGKSEYSRYVAERMGKRVLYKRASDLQSMWVGECEKNIAKAFEQAREEEMVLIIDEGDSFLRDREKARASWEVSQVNEMLSQMESHTQPFFLTTNLMKDLDAASMRRFTFKLQFKFLRSEQSRSIFEAYFEQEAPVKLDELTILAPGDFAAVKKRADILNVRDTDELLGMLKEEVVLKPQYKGGGRIGF